MKNSKKLTNYLAVLVWCGLIFILSNSPRITTVDLQIVDFALKKIAHFIEYFILGMLTYRATNNILISISFCILFAVSDEFHQSFIPGREPRVRDVIIDSFGSITAIIIWNNLSQNLKKIQKKLVRR